MLFWLEPPPAANVMVFELAVSENSSLVTSPKFVFGATAVNMVVLPQLKLN